MKFLCDNCKAKYQIADDKVAGKTVRMKCRKCGHLIEIRASAALAEATAFRSLPAEELSRIVDPATASASPSAPAPAAPAPRPAAGAPGRTAPAPAAGAPRRTTTTSPATSGAPAPRPGAAPVRSIGASAGATKGATALARAPEPEAEPEEAPATGGLASAFSQSVGASVTPDDPSAGSSFDMGATTAEEWYSGINGVPVGPMRLSELRSKIAAGLITDESLVWREGFEEWVALRTVPGLVDLARSSAPNEKLSATPSRRPGGSVRTAAASNVVSLRPEAAEPPKPSSPEEHDDATSVFSGAMLGPGAFGASEQPSAPVAAGTPAATSAPTTDSASLSAMADPFAAPAPLLGAGASSEVAPVAATPLPAPVVASEPVIIKQPARIPAMAWVVVALALAVGVVGGTMLVPKPPADVTVQTVVVEKVVAAPTSASPDVTTKVGDSDPVTDPSASAKRPVAVGPGLRPSTTSTPSAIVAAVSPPLNSLPPLPGQTSPSPLPNSATPPTSTETIPAGKLQEIVAGQRNSLRRVCWDPLVSSGAVTGSVKANVNLTIVNGQVTSVSVSGADARMSGCVQTRVRGWQFPTGYAATNTSFVLAFVAQAQ